MQCWDMLYFLFVLQDCVGDEKWVLKPNGRMYKGKIVAEQKQLLYGVRFEDGSVKTYSNINDIEVK